MQIESVEMSVRDGFQNEKYFVATANKLELITRAINARLKRIEVTGFQNLKRMVEAKLHTMPREKFEWMISFICYKDGVLKQA